MFVVATSLAAWITAVAGGPEPVALFEQRQLGRALKAAEARLADETTDPEHRQAALLVRVFALARQGRTQDAEQALAALEAEGIELGPLGTSLRVEWAASQQRCQEASAAAESLAVASPYGAHAWTRVAACFLGQGDVDATRTATTRLATTTLGESRRAFLGYLEGRTAERAGDIPAARASYERVVRELPTTTGAESASERLHVLRKVGRRTAAALQEEALAEAEALRARNRLPQARKAYESIRATGNKKRDLVVMQRAELGLAQLDMVARDYANAARRVEPLQTARADEVRAEALYLLGDLHARRGHAADALTTWRRLMDALPQSGWAVAGALAGARIAHGARYLRRSQEFARWVLDHPTAVDVAVLLGEDGVHHRGEPPADQARWLLAWSERRAGGSVSTVEEHLTRIGGTSLLAQGALYWRARMASDRGDVGAMARLLGELAAMAPASYYAMLAADLAAKHGLEGAAAPPLTTASGPERATPPTRELRGLLVLLQFGLASEARERVRSLPITDLPAAERMAAAWVYARAGELSRATLVARKAVLQLSADEGPGRVTLELAFPRPFTELIGRESERYGVPMELIYAVMREESAFDPEALSPRLARGLMQMMPATGKRIALEAGMPSFSPKRLFQPEVAIRLGTHYLANLLELFEGDLVSTIAAYHAGEDAVGRWRAARAELAGDEFVEDLPFPSTRGYVKKVLSALAMYRMLYAATEGQPLLGLKPAGAPRVGVATNQSPADQSAGL